MSDGPVWVSQWPLTHEKLLAAQELIMEQLTLGHIVPSTSPWNTPIFVIKKKSGKWRLLHDLRAINATMQPMGAVQPGVPLATAVPRDWYLIVIDIKDCFFSIPLHHQDSKRFAFTLPSINHLGPDQRYQWVVLPQGMMSSPTMCQLYVAQAVCPVRQKFPHLCIYHYMDDILVAGEQRVEVQAALVCLKQELAAWKLYIAPEKIQEGQDVK